MNRSCTYLILPLTVTMRLPSRGYSTAGGGVGNCTPQHGVFQLNQRLTQGLCLSHWVTLQSRTSHIKLLLLILTTEAKCPHDWSVSQKYPILPALPLVYWSVSQKYPILPALPLVYWSVSQKYPILPALPLVYWSVSQKYAILPALPLVYWSVSQKYAILPALPLVYWSVSQKYPILPALPLVYLEWVRVNKK